MAEAARRRRAVHWEDEHHEPSPLRPANGSLSTGGQRRRRDGTRSAAATLSLYLSDALGENGQTSAAATRRRARCRDPHEPVSHEYVSIPRSNTTGESSLDDTEPTVRPASPLSRFMQQRIRLEGRSVLRPRDTNASLSAPIRDRVLGPRAFPLSSVSSSGSMERLLREKIMEAKRLRNVDAGRPSGVENRSPNQASAPPYATTIKSSVHAFSSLDLSTHVPIPHSKPQRPQLTVQSKPSSSSQAAPHEQRRATPEEIGKNAAVRRLQRFWRRIVFRRSQRPTDTASETLSPSPSETASEAVSGGRSRGDDCGSDGDVIRNVEGYEDRREGPVEEAGDHLRERSPAESPGGTASIHPELMETQELPNPIVSKTSSEAAIQTEEVDDSETQLADEEDDPWTATSSLNLSLQLLPWQDDEWSFLEEGRFAATELLDSSVHNEDQSIEALVWTKPHVAVQRLEATRRERERSRRANARKKTHGDPGEASVPTHITDPAQREKIRVRIKLQRRKKRLRVEVQPRLVQSDEVHESIEADVSPSRSAADELDAVDTTDTSERMPSQSRSDDVYATMLAQLHRYVVFSNASSVSDRSSARERNDLIVVDPLVPMDSDTEPANDAQDEAVDAECPTGADAEHCSIVDGSESTDPTTEEPTPSSRPIAPVPTSHTADIAPACGEPSEPATRLVPALHDVKREFHRTLVRTQLHAPPPALPPSTPLLSAPRSTLPVDSRLSSASSPLHEATQREFRRALDAFQRSLRASSACSSASASSSHTLGPLLPSEEIEEKREEDAVDAELEAMLSEIRRCKQQIADARRQMDA